MALKVFWVVSPNNSLVYRWEYSSEWQLEDDIVAEFGSYFKLSKKNFLKIQHNVLLGLIENDTLFMGAVDPNQIEKGPAEKQIQALIKEFWKIIPPGKVDEVSQDQLTKFGSVFAHGS